MRTDFYRVILVLLLLITQQLARAALVPDLSIGEKSIVKIPPAYGTVALNMSKIVPRINGEGFVAIGAAENDTLALCAYGNDGKVDRSFGNSGTGCSLIPGDNAGSFTTLKVLGNDYWLLFSQKVTTNQAVTRYVGSIVKISDNGTLNRQFANGQPLALTNSCIPITGQSPLIPTCMLIPSIFDDEFPFTISNGEVWLVMTQATPDPTSREYPYIIRSDAIVRLNAITGAYIGLVNEPLYAMLPADVLVKIAGLHTTSQGVLVETRRDDLQTVKRRVHRLSKDGVRDLSFREVDASLVTSFPGLYRTALAVAADGTFFYDRALYYRDGQLMSDSALPNHSIFVIDPTQFHTKFKIYPSTSFANNTPFWVVGFNFLGRVQGSNWDYSVIGARSPYSRSISDFAVAGNQLAWVGDRTPLCRSSTY